MAVSCCAMQHILKCKMERKIFIFIGYFSLIFFLSVFPTVDTFRKLPRSEHDPKTGDSQDVSYLDLYVSASYC